MGYTYGEVPGSDEGIKMGSINGKVISTILGNVDVITIGLDFGTELGALDGFFVNIHGLLWWPKLH